MCVSVQNQALELSWGHGSPVFLSWTQNRTSGSLDSHKVELCRQLGEKLGLRDGEQVQLHNEHFVLCSISYHYLLKSLHDTCWQSFDSLM